nr:hydroxymethylglutaryl-CoA reductase, degradative [uncultured Capnocytophaga sp.]
MKHIDGFSKLTKAEKIQWLCNTYFPKVENAKALFEKYHNADTDLQKLHDEFIENTVSNYYLPFAVAPNFIINGHTYTVPMAIEESSVVAAASKAAKFWQSRGGFHSEVLSTEKTGHVHFFFYDKKAHLEAFFARVQPLMLANAKPITANMEKRGGGITSLTLVDKTEALADYYQLSATFETLDAMGANFINSCLESFAETFREEAEKDATIRGQYEIVMSILSNYVPNCLVRAEVYCPVEELEIAHLKGMDAAKKFVQALAIANADVYRATTHNKGIMNGIDSVILATGNDFRAIEAGAHAYAARSGNYKSLSNAWIEGDTFHFALELPLALGTVGGLTTLHPLVKTALEILEKPNARELMQIVACVGLAQNFSAVSSLISLGIQKGHMKMHLNNIFNQLGATDEEKQQLTAYFKDKTVSHNEVAEALKKKRKGSQV